MTYNAYITRVTNVRKHPNADRLQLADCFGNTVVVGLDVTEGKLGVYFPTDGRLSPEFLEKNNLIGVKNPDGTRTGGMFDEKGKVRAQKIRQVKSEGFWCELTLLDYTYVPYDMLVAHEGKPFTEMNGFKICEKYVNDSTRTARGDRKAKPRAKESCPLFYEHKDTEQLEYNINELPVEAVLTMTEKVHGTSQRSGYTIVETPVTGWRAVINGLFKRNIYESERTYKYVCGTRHVVIHDFEKYSGFAGGVEKPIRKAHHEVFVGKLHKGETIYYEIVGYWAKNNPIMGRCENKKIVSDKEFTKRYGDVTTFHYGCPDGESSVYVYRITMVNEDGIEYDLDYSAIVKRCAELNVKPVPLIAQLIYKGAGESLLETTKDFLNGTPEFPQAVASTITPAHIMEGVVVRVNNSKWKAYKLKSWAFKVIEQGIKDSGMVDAEEVQGE